MLMLMFYIIYNIKTFNKMLYANFLLNVSPKPAN